MEAVKETASPVEKEKGTFELIQEGLSNTSREIWLAGLGVYSTIDKEGTRLFNKFVERGREMVGNGAEPLKAKNGKEPGPTYVSEKKDKMTHEIISRLDNAAKFVQDKIFGAAEPSNVSRDEVKDLSEKVNKLTETVAILVQKLEESGKAGAKARTTA